MDKTNIRRHYGVIERGCSILIPINVKNEDDEPIDLSKYTVIFTVKSNEYDFDRYDEKAFISKKFAPQYPVDGKFNIVLTSQELDFPPGEYFFDVVLRHNETKDSTRIIMCDFELKGGPSNWQVSPNGSGSIMSATGFDIFFVTGKPFIVYSPSLTGAQITNFESRIAALERKP